MPFQDKIRITKLPCVIFNACKILCVIPLHLSIYIPYLMNGKGDNNLEIHNYSFMLWITLAVVCLILTFILHMDFLLLSIGLVIYAFIKRTSTSARNDLIKHMQNYWLERKYQIYFGQSRYCEIDDFSDNHSNNAHENRQQKWLNLTIHLVSPYFQLGNHANDIQHCIYGEWHIQERLSIHVIQLPLCR